MAEDGLAAQVQEHMNEQLALETEQLKAKLAIKEQEATQNAVASEILRKFINNGDAVVDEHG